MKRILILFLLTGITFIGKTQTNQTRYLIKFKDKGSSPYSLANPSAYLSQRAINRRTRYNISIDSTDLPVTPRYLDSIRLAGSVTILNVSRWLNQVSIQTTDAAALNKINSFPFVQSTAPIAARQGNTPKKFEVEESNVSGRLEANYYNYNNNFAQVHIHNGEFLHNIGLRGQGMRIGMLDGGFTNYNTLTAFDSIRNRNGFLDVFNFVSRNTNVNTAAHGLECLSTIGTNLPNNYVGTAPAADFLLYVSEDVGSEYPIEEHNWVCAAERTDSSGGDVISSSLGYSTFDNPAYDHTYAQMNGRTTMAAIGATWAARKGIMVLNSAGNEGTSTWHYIMTPADADSILAVGAVGYDSVAASFSSYGPASDLRIKPDVASVGLGTKLVYIDGSIISGNGTSFSCPNMAGLATCLWQGFQEFNNIKIIKALIQASHKYNTPDNRVGFGIPDVKKATMNLLKDFVTGNTTQSTCKTTINWTSKDVAGMKYQVERQNPGSSSFTLVGEQLGSGNVFGSPHTYSFSDSLINVPFGIINYRIRQVIDTATTTAVSDFIIIKSVTLPASCITTSIPVIPVITDDLQLLPNPAYNSVMLRLVLDAPVQKLRIFILDAAGKEVQKMETTAANGINTIPINISNLAKGKYIVTVYKNERLWGSKELIRL